VGEKMVESLNQCGFLTAKDIVREGAEGLLKVPGIGPKTAQRIFNKAKEMTD